MKLLCYQAQHFSWTPASQTLPQADKALAGSVEDAAVIWLHVEEEDEKDERRVFKRCLKTVKWVANKRNLNTIVLHSFAHLGGTTANPDFAQSFITKLKIRLEKNQYDVKTTPFGWFCAWNLEVYGDSMAKVFIHIPAKPAT